MSEPTCTRRRIEGGGPMCGLPGVPILVGCVHEHVIERVACPKHLAYLRENPAGSLCEACCVSTDPHYCTPHLLRVGDETVPQRAAS